MKNLHVLKTSFGELRRLAALSLLVVPFGFLQAEPLLPAPAGIVEVQPACEIEEGIIRITSPSPGPGITYSIDATTYTNTTGVFEHLEPGTYSVTYRNAEGSVSEPLLLTVNPRPEIPDPVTATVTRQPSCEIPTGIITITSPSPAPGLVFTYYYSGQEGVSTTTGVFTGLAPGQYYLTVTNADGCSSYATPLILNSVPGAPAVPVLSVSQTCGVLTGTITVTSPAPAEGISYSLDGTNFNNTTGVFKDLSPGSYNISVKNAAGCLSAPASATIVDATIPLKAPEIRILEQPQCDLTYGSFEVTYPDPSLTGYTYSIDGVNYVVRVGSYLDPGTYNVTYKTPQGCISPATTVTIIDGPDTPAEGPVLQVTQHATCESPGTITVTSPSPGPGFTYYINLGQEYSASTTGVFTGLVTGNYMVYYKTPGGCDSPHTSIFLPGSSPAARPGAFIDSAVYICAGTTATYTVPMVISTTYGWSYSGSGAEITAEGSSATVCFSATATSGILSVIAENSCGVSTARELSITVRQLPGAPGIISGPTDVCAGARGVVFSVPLIPNAVHYNWDLPYGAIIVGGYDTNTITVDFSEDATSGRIIVWGSKLCGDGPSSQPVYVNVNRPPIPGEFTAATTTVCAGSTYRYMVPGQPGVEYNWQYSGTGATFAFQNFNYDMYITFAEDATSGILSVIAVSVCGTSAAGELPVTVKQLPGPASAISGPAEVLKGMKGVVYTVPVIQNAVHYIWKVPEGATIVSGEDTNTITVDFSDNAVSGVITVQGSKSCGTGPVSPEFNVTVKTAIAPGSLKVGIYPVPGNGSFTITMIPEYEEIIDIMIFNSAGNKVSEMKKVVVRDRTEIPVNLENLPSGTYYLKFTGPGGQISRKIILSR